MIDNKLLEKLLENLGNSKNSVIQVWIERIKNNQKGLIGEIIWLCFNFKEIPKSEIAVYVDLFINALSDELEETVPTKIFLERVFGFVKFLESLGECEKADKIREIISKEEGYGIPT